MIKGGAQQPGEIGICPPSHIGRKGMPARKRIQIKPETQRAVLFCHHLSPSLTILGHEQKTPALESIQKSRVSECDRVHLNASKDCTIKLVGTMVFRSIYLLIYKYRQAEDISSMFLFTAGDGALLIRGRPFL